jgi:hypothetical protein
MVGSLWNLAKSNENNLASLYKNMYILRGQQRHVFLK